MENWPFIGDLPIQISIAMLVYRRVASAFLLSPHQVQIRGRKCRFSSSARSRFSVSCRQSASSFLRWWSVPNGRSNFWVANRFRGKDIFKWCDVFLIHFIHLSSLSQAPDTLPITGRTPSYQLLARYQQKHHWGLVGQKSQHSDSQNGSNESNLGTLW